MSQALIIDDSADFRASARQLLEAEGYTVTEAATGAEGIRIAEELAFELVLLDIQLPDLDGFEVAESAGLPRAAARSSPHLDARPGRLRLAPF